ncbi:TIGR00180 family glycosyltransferase [Leptospira alstonii]|nr:TIGR00180 family glycosyltransferase [Leptospira alstonii]
MNVTILLTLKGRPLHTLRWLWHHNRIQLPFKIVIADGGNYPEIVRLLSEPKNFPNLNYKYFRYQDNSLEDYWFKLADIITKIDTPYVMFSDNDDFILSDAVLVAENLLETHSDCISVCSTALNFALKDKNSEFDQLRILGDLYNFSSQGGIDYDAEDCVVRVKQFLNRSYYFFYSLTRTEAWIDIFKEVKEINFKNFDVWERFIYLSLVIKGKIIFSIQPSYLRQLGSSETHASVTPWINRLFFSDWMGDFQSMVPAIIRRAEKFTSVSNASVLDTILRKVYVDAMPMIIENHLTMTNAYKKSFLKKMISKAKDFSLIRRFYGRAKINKIFKFLKSQGLDDFQLKKVKNELDEVRQTLKHSDLYSKVLLFKEFD